MNEVSVSLHVFMLLQERRVGDEGRWAGARTEFAYLGIQDQLRGFRRLGSFRDLKASGQGLSIIGG